MNMNQLPTMLYRYLPILTWETEYSRPTLADRLMLAALVGIMLVLHPKSWLSREELACRNRERS
jgi:hypothetical protein